MCWDLKESQVIQESRAKLMQLKHTHKVGNFFVFAVNKHILNFDLPAKALEDKMNFFKIQI